MAIKFRVRDFLGRTVIDENMLMCRYLTSVTIDWDDQSEHIIQHSGFEMGTPFYNVYNPNRHTLNLTDAPVRGNASYIECSFSGDVATVKQTWAVGSSWDMTGRESLIVYLGVMG